MDVYSVGFGFGWLGRGREVCEGGRWVGEVEGVGAKFDVWVEGERVEDGVDVGYEEGEVEVESGRAL